MFIKCVAMLAVLLFMPSAAFAGDSTGGIGSPSVSVQTVVGGTACPGVGAIAQTAAGSYATCQGGVWTPRNISNPVYVQASAPLVGAVAVSAFAQCPPGMKILFSSCLVYAASSSSASEGFFHDEHGPAGGIDAATSFPIVGDTGAYCYYVSSLGSSGYVMPHGVCGDR